MSFDYRETSRNEGHPVGLYAFRYGPGDEDFIRYNNTDQVYQVEEPIGGVPTLVSYDPVPISRQGVTASGDLDRSTFEIRTDKDCDLVGLYAGYPPSHVVSFIIREGHMGDDEFLVVMSGRIVGLTYEGSEAVFSCEPAFTSIRRAGLRRNYQIPCPHLLFGPDCRASREAATETYTVASVAGARVTFAPGWEDPEIADKFVGGVAEWTDGDGRFQKRTVVKRDGNTLVLTGTATGLLAADSIDLVKGCSHVLVKEGGTVVGDCKDVHANQQNYGGCLDIPSENPFGVKNGFY
jgi:hypothetical protein